MIEEVNMSEIDKYPYNLYLREVKCLEVLKNIIDYSRLYTQIESIVFRISGRFDESSQLYKELPALLNNPLLKNERNALSFKARMNYHASLANGFRLLNHWEKSYFHYTKILQLLEKSPSNLNRNIEFYLTMIARFSVTIVRLKRYEELKSLYNKVEKFKKSIPQKMQFGSLSQKFWNIRIIQVHNLLLVFDIDKALKYSEEILISEQKYFSPVTYLVFHMNLFFIHFFLHDFHKALKQVNLILNIKEPLIRQDIFKVARVCNIVVHYELGNEDLLSSLCAATFRSFKKKDQLGEAERILLNFFGKTIHGKEKSGQRENALIKLKTEIEPILSKRNVFDHLDFISWIESKIENRSYLKIAKSRAGF